MSGKNKVKDITLKTIEIIKKIKNRQHEIDQLIATVIILVDKLLDEETIEKLWEEFKMLNVFKYAEERGKKEGFQEGIEKGIEKGIEIGIEKGIEKGIERGVGKGIAETIIRLLCKKLGELPDEYKDRILSQDRPTLELIADHIFDIESPGDLERFLKQ
jgi:flagellar biosynthesis/type III secretory pathway protein FliH